MHDQRVLFTMNSKSFEVSARLLDKPNEDKLAGEKSHLMKDMTDEILIEVGSQKCKS